MIDLRIYRCIKDNEVVKLYGFMGITQTRIMVPSLFEVIPHWLVNVIMQQWSEKVNGVGSS
jgi:hypothetical protein